MSKILKNTTGSIIFVNDAGVSIPAMGDYTIPPQDYLLWAASSDIVGLVGSGDVVVNDGSFDLSISDGIDLIKGLFPKTIFTVPSGTPVWNYAEITSAASGSEHTVQTFTAAADGRLSLIDVAGTNIARYKVKVNGTTKDSAYTYFGGALTHSFGYGQGVQVSSGDVITVTVEHVRPTLGNFNSKIVFVED